MAQQAVIVNISVAGGEVEDLQDLVDGKEVELDWIGSLNGQDVPIKVRIADAVDDEADMQDQLVAAIDGIVRAWDGGDLAGAVNYAREVAEEARA